MSNLVQEMYYILGRPDGTLDVPETKSIPDREPREIAGTFVVHSEVTSMDEHILYNISELNWEQITDLALLSTIKHNDLQDLISSYSESSSAFRDTWSSMVETGDIDKTVPRGAFVLLSKLSPKTESQSKYIDWCVKVFQESGSGVQAKAIGKSSKFHGIIPSGSTDSQQAKSVNHANKYMTPHTMDNDRPLDKNIVMHNDAIKNTPGQTASSVELPADKGLAAVKKAEAAMGKAASKVGKDAESAFPNLWNLLARERARHS